MWAPSCAAALQQVFLLENVQHGQRRGAGNRAAGIGAAQAACRGGVHHLGAAHHAGDRVATGHGFGHGDHVRRDAALLDGKPGAGAAGAGLNFVGNQQNAVLVAQGAQALQKLGGGHIEAAFALHRFHDDGGHAAGFDVVLENAIQSRRSSRPRSRRGRHWGTGREKSRSGTARSQVCTVPPCRSDPA